MSAEPAVAALFERDEVFRRQFDQECCPDRSTATVAPSQILGRRGALPKSLDIKITFTCPTCSAQHTWEEHGIRRELPSIGRVTRCGHIRVAIDWSKVQ